MPHDQALARRRGDALHSEPLPRPTPEELLGLPNRRRMQDAIDAAYEHLRTGGVASGVVLIDLDGLAHANNDTRLGLARRLSNILRRDDLVARFAGDVFVVVACGIRAAGCPARRTAPPRRSPQASASRSCARTTRR